MKHVLYGVASAALAVALSGCGDPYPRYGTSQTYYSPTGYTSVPADSSSYNSRSDYYRNYNGIHAAPERTGP